MTRGGGGGKARPAGPPSHTEHTYPMGDELGEGEGDRSKGKGTPHVHLVPTFAPAVPATSRVGHGCRAEAAARKAASKPSPGPGPLRPGTASRTEAPDPGAERARFEAQK